MKNQKKSSNIYKKDATKIRCSSLADKSELLIPPGFSSCSLSKTQLSRAEMVVFVERIAILVPPIQHKHISRPWVPRVGGRELSINQATRSFGCDKCLMYKTNYQIKH